MEGLNMRCAKCGTDITRFMVTTVSVSYTDQRYKRRVDVEHLCDRCTKNYRELWRNWCGYHGIESKFRNHPDRQVPRGTQEG